MNHHPHKRRPPPPDAYEALRAILDAAGDLARDASRQALDSADGVRFEWIDRRLADVCLAVERLFDHLQYDAAQ